MTVWKVQEHWNGLRLAPVEAEKVTDSSVMIREHGRLTRNAKISDYQRFFAAELMAVEWMRSALIARQEKAKSDLARLDNQLDELNAKYPVVAE